MNFRAISLPSYFTSRGAKSLDSYLERTPIYDDKEQSQRNQKSPQELYFFIFATFYNNGRI